MEPIDPHGRRSYIRPMKNSSKINSKEHGDNPEHKDPHASDAEDLAQFAEEDEVDISHLGESMDESEEGEPSPDDVIADLTAQLATARDQTMRALAEAENTRKRAIKDRQDAGRFASASFARDMLEVADNLRRAIEAIDSDQIPDDPQIQNLLAGIESTEKVLLKNFEKNNVVRLNPLDEPFDPNFHEVMFETPMPDKAPGTIIQVMEVGYTLNDRLLRPARVGVVKAEDVSSGTDPHEPGENLDTEA